MSRTIYRGIEAFAAAAGTDLGASEWHPVTQEQVQQFADATGDHQWIHLDVERAKTGPFGGTVAHGFFTLSLVPLILDETYRVEGPSMMVNYGLNKVRFPNPVLVGSKVRGRTRLIEVVETSRGVQATAEITIEIEGADKPACVVEAVTLFVP